MSLSDGDIAFATDLFADLPDLTTRKMFGGLGLYSEGCIFAVMRSDGAILLKAQDGPFARQLADLGATKWTHTRKNGVQSSMPYWVLPDVLLDDTAAVTELARAASAAIR